jgi:multiple sugar transport system substrate-binding protein
MVYRKFVEKSRCFLGKVAQRISAFFKVLFRCLSAVSGKAAQRICSFFKVFFRRLSAASGKVAKKISAFFKALVRRLSVASGKAAQRISPFFRALVQRLSTVSGKIVQKTSAFFKVFVLRLSAVSGKAAQRICSFFKALVWRLSVASGKAAQRISPFFRVLVQRLSVVSGKAAEKTSAFFKASVLRLSTASGKASKKLDLFLFFTLLVLLLGFILFNTALRKANHQRRIELVLSPQWEALFDRETLGGLIRNFEDQNPHLRIGSPGNESRAADILFFNEGLFRSLVQRESLCPLGAYLDSQNDAEQWAIPLLLSMDVLFYNIDLLAKAGFDRPPKTRDDFLKYVHAVSVAGHGTYGTALGLSPEDPLAIKREFFSWFWAAGLPLEKDGKPLLESRPAAEIINFLAQVKKEGPPTQDVFARTGIQLLEEFSQGKIAMIIAPAEAISFLQSRMGDSSFGITVIPGASTPGKNILGLSGFYAGISSRCAYPDEAWNFLTFITENSPNPAIKTVPGNLPVVGAFPDDFINDDPLYAKAWDIFESSDIAETSIGLPLAIELEQIVREELFKFFNEGRTAQNVVVEIQKRWDSVSSTFQP